MKKLIRNKIFLSVLCFAGGLGILAWGHDKDESTIAKKSKGGVVIMVAGGAIAVAGFGGMLVYGSNAARRL